MIHWLAPLGLAVFAAWAIPLLIHWWPRPRVQRVDFAALKRLPPRSRERRRAQLHERVLLALRLALLSLLALWLAQPMLHTQGEARNWLLVHPALAGSAAAAEDGTEAHWLAPGFPPLTASPPAAGVPLASLLRQLDAELPPAVQLRVRVPAQLQGLDAERLRLGRELQWQTVDMPPTASAPLSVAVHTGEAGAQRVLDALLAAWQAQGRAFSMSTADAAAPPADVQLVWWLDATAPPEALLRWVRDGGTLCWLPATQADGEPRIADDAGRPLLYERGEGAGRLYTASTAFDPKAMPALADDAMPARLWALLSAPSPQRLYADAKAVAPIRDSQIVSGPWQAPDGLLRALLLMLFVAERLWALRARTPA